MVITMARTAPLKAPTNAPAWRSNPFSSAFFSDLLTEAKIVHTISDVPMNRISIAAKRLNGASAEMYGVIVSGNVTATK